MSYFGKTLTIEGADDAAFSSGVISKAVDVLANHIVEGVPDIKSFWGYKKLNDGKTYYEFQVECEPFSNLPVADAPTQTEGDYRMLKAVLRKPYKRITASTLERMPDYWGAMDEITAGDQSTYSLTALLPIEVSITGESDSLDKQRARRNYSMTLTSVEPVS